MTSRKIDCKQRASDLKLMCGVRDPITIASFLTALSIGTIASAEPVVSGNTISWPTDGWYQVQSLPGYESMCEGGSSCTVTPGDYIVINHTTGERFEDISVPAGDNRDSSITTVIVNGNQLSWPDDGWYQVQSLPDYTSVCEGGTSCRVSPGEYIVINHTSGQRYEGILVEDSETGSGETSVHVDGNTIRWPADGWYQVQSQSDYMSVCEGGNSCDVASGVYTVINHTTGERFENVNVSGGGSSNGDGSGQTSPLLTGFANRRAFERSVKDALTNFYTNDGGRVAIAEPVFVQDDSVPSPTAPMAGESADQSTVSGADAGDFTTTNLQEQGVDEADWVKTDGRFIYVLGNSSVAPAPFPGDPVIDLPVFSPVAATSIAPVPYPEPQSIGLRVLELDSVAADATVASETEIQIQGQSVDGMYLHAPDSGENALVLTSTSHAGFYWNYWSTPDFWGNTTSSVHRVSVANQSSPALETTVTFDGQIISSRVVGEHLYVASRFFPEPPGLNDPSVTPADLIESLNIDEILPQIYHSDETASPLSSPENCFVSALPDNAYHVPDIITLAAINIRDLTVSDSVCYLGDIETLYASPNAAFLSSTSYDYQVGSSAERQTLSRTDVHQFDFDSGALSYRGSGRVPGYVSGSVQQRSFRFSHSGDYLRIVTENDRSPVLQTVDDERSPQADDSPVFVSVLKPGDGQALELVARLPNDAQPQPIGKPGEQLYASRFIGDKGYLVTFRQVDPLYVIDFSNPENPFVSGELVIEGYSDYLHPVGENHLLGLGRGAIPDPFGGGDGRGAFVTGIKLSLFDVSDAANPIEVQALEIGRRGSSAEALFDHHGITYRPGTEAQPGRLAFAINVHDIPSNDTFNPVPFYHWRQTGLYTFEVRTGDSAGIDRVGELIVEAATRDNPTGPYESGDRSVLIDDAVFYVHGHHVYGAQWGSVEAFTGPR